MAQRIRLWSSCLQIALNRSVADCIFERDNDGFSNNDNDNDPDDGDGEDDGDYDVNGESHVNGDGDKDGELLFLS